MAEDRGKDLNGNMNLHQAIMTMKLWSERKMTETDL